MTDDQLEDLKQFIDSRISQSESITNGKFAKVDAKIEALRQEMLGGFAGVGEAIEEINHRIDQHLAVIHQRPA